VKDTDMIVLFTDVHDNAEGRSYGNRTAQGADVQEAWRSLIDDLGIEAEDASYDDWRAL